MGADSDGVEKLAPEQLYNEKETNGDEYDLNLNNEFEKFKKKLPECN